MPTETIYLADLTHTGQSVASNVFPLGVGLLASYLELQLPNQYETEVFKYPEDFNEALRRQVPRLVGFSNYSWNRHLSMEYARRVKRDFPSTVVIAGGPNYGLQPEEVEAFWERHPFLDFYVVKEGERALVELVQTLERFDYNVAALKDSGSLPPNCHFLSRSGEIVQAPLAPRVKDLSELGSPYLQGKMDKFFDGVLVPMVHTTRGCPFECTFCSEGNSYYAKVAQRISLEEELVYIAERVGPIHELMLTDANFGMFAQDKAKAEVLAKMQVRFGWPKMISTSTGKNQKKRVLEVASMLGGALTIAASLQSTDEKVLENIRRKNISQDALAEMVAESTSADSRTYTELILGLPGDTVATHTKSLADTVDAGLGIVRNYQMILLPQTEMCEPETRRRFDLVTRFRINQRCFGEYPYLDGVFPSVECEEICVSTNTLSRDQYLDCRELDLAVELFHNSGMFPEFQGLACRVGLSWFEVLRAAFERARAHPEIAAICTEFRTSSLDKLWATQDELESQVLDDLRSYLDDSGGTNEMVKAKALVVLHHQEMLQTALCEELASRLEAADARPILLDYLGELEDFSTNRKRDFLRTGSTFEMKTHFAMDRMQASNFQDDPEEHYSEAPQRVRFFYTPDQERMIESYITRYGSSVEGMGRILMRSHTHVSELYRSIQVGESA